MRLTGKQEEKDEINLRNQNPRGHKLLLLKCILLKKKEKQHLKQDFSHKLPFFFKLHAGF